MNENNNLNYQIKVVKGFIRYESGIYDFSSEKVAKDKYRQSIDMPEDLAGVYLNIVIFYAWHTDSSQTLCDVKIGWELTNPNGSRLSPPLSYNFS